jgi:ABC-2 type transport system permease protein
MAAGTTLPAGDARDAGRWLPTDPSGRSGRSGAPYAAGSGAAGGASMLGQSAWLAARQLRALLRQPAYLSISLIQAVVWLPLFGSLFHRVIDVPGFAARSYFDFLTPGVVVMSAMFSAGWSGMSFINDMDRGVMHRLLAAPVRRGALIAGSLGHTAVLITIQTAIIMLLGWALGTHYGPASALIVVAAILLAFVVAALSDGLALLVRKEESLIAAVNFLVLPLTFLSSAMIDRPAMPGWIRAVSRYNPVDWAVTAARSAASAHPDAWTVGGHLAYLAALAVISAALAARAFNVYRRAM